MDQKQDPLPGATVIIKGTTIGTVTNTDGKFTLKVPEDMKTLLVSFVGYKSKEVQLGVADSVTVVLEEDVVAMEDVVVTGFFERKKEGYAGTVTTIKKKICKNFLQVTFLPQSARLMPGLKSMKTMSMVRIQTNYRISRFEEREAFRMVRLLPCLFWMGLKFLPRKYSIWT